MDKQLESTTFSTPLGWMSVATDGVAITELLLPNRVEQRPPLSNSVPDAPLLRAALRQLESYFAGELQEFDLPLAPQGTEHQRRVWEELRQIPYGALISYGELARRIGRPTASRAVGAANGKNPIAIIVPCHRVIGADGSLTGYGGGIEVKKWLIRHEAEHAAPEVLQLDATLTCR